FPTRRPSHGLHGPRVAPADHHHHLATPPPPRPPPSVPCTRPQPRALPDPIRISAKTLPGGRGPESTRSSPRSIPPRKPHHRWNAPPIRAPPRRLDDSPPDLPQTPPTCQTNHSRHPDLPHVAHPTDHHPHTEATSP